MLHRWYKNDRFGDDTNNGLAKLYTLGQWQPSNCQNISQKKSHGRW